MEQALTLQAIQIIAGIEAWEDETITRENCDKFDKDTKLLIENKRRLQEYSFKKYLESFYSKSNWRNIFLNGFSKR